MLVIWHRNRLTYYRKHYGRLGGLWVRLCVRLRIWEEWWSIGRRNRRDPKRKRDERAFLRQSQRELWSQ